MYNITLVWMGAIQQDVIGVQHKFASFREGHFNDIINID